MNQEQYEQLLQLALEKIDRLEFDLKRAQETRDMISDDLEKLQSSTNSPVSFSSVSLRDLFSKVREYFLKTGGSYMLREQPDKIGAIKALRDCLPGIGLKEAKVIIEAVDWKAIAQKMDYI